jgi:hypothetical protein
MYSGGEDCSARIWDLKMRNLSCQRIYQVYTLIILHKSYFVAETGEVAWFGVVYARTAQNEKQCCGSGMFIPDPIFHSGSRVKKIPDPH